MDTFVKKNMVVLVLLTLIIGFFTGLYISKSTIQHLKSFIIPSAFIMLWAMMVDMDIQKFVNAIKYPRELIVGNILSLAIAPILMLPIAYVFAPNPKMYAGLVLAGIVPPGGFIAYWTGILYADLALAIAIQLTTFLISLVWIPYGMKWLVGGKVDVNVSALFEKILILIVAPFILAIITRNIILRASGEKGLRKARPSLHFISSLMAILLVFVGMSIKSKAILAHPTIILLPAIGAFLYYLIERQFPFIIIIII